MSFPVRLSRLAAAALMAGMMAACASHALKQARAADELRDYDLAVAEYKKAVRQRPNDKDARLGLDRALLRASDEHLLRGRRLFSQGRFDDALVELQLAVELNPTNSDAERDLRAVRSALRAKLSAPAEGGQTALESLLARAHTLAPAGPDLPDTKLPAQISTGAQMTNRLLYITLAQLGGISVTFDPQFREAAVGAVLLNNMTLRQALDAVATATASFYRVNGQNSIIVAPNTPAKQREYAEEVVATIYLQNADLKEAMDTLRVVGDLRSISQVSSLNAIAVRDTQERVVAAQKLIAAFDKARPEIVVDVEVLEIDRTRLKEYGLQLASPGSAGIDGALDANRENITLQSLRSLSAADVLATNIPVLYYRLLKTDERTRTLANPHIRIVDGVQAKANFGEEVPVPKTVIAPITQGGLNIQPQTTFEYRPIGVNLGITPRIHANDEVTLGLDIELSSIAGAGFEGLPSFGSRSVNTTIRLRDGQTNILAGLIRDDERIRKESLPGLGDVPVLGSLFARNRREAQQTDVVIMLTPHIVRTLDLTEDDLRPFRVPRDGTTIEGGPIVPPPPPIRGGGGGSVGHVPHPGAGPRR